MLWHYLVSLVLFLSTQPGLQSTAGDTKHIGDRCTESSECGVTNSKCRHHNGLWQNEKFCSCDVGYMARAGTCEKVAPIKLSSTSAEAEDDQGDAKTISGGKVGQSQNKSPPQSLTRLEKLKLISSNQLPPHSLSRSRGKILPTGPRPQNGAKTAAVSAQLRQKPSQTGRLKPKPKARRRKLKSESEEVDLILPSTRTPLFVDGGPIPAWIFWLPTPAPIMEQDTPGLFEKPGSIRPSPTMRKEISSAQVDNDTLKEALRLGVPEKNSKSSNMYVLPTVSVKVNKSPIPFSFENFMRDLMKDSRIADKLFTNPNTKQVSKFVSDNRKFSNQAVSRVKTHGNRNRAEAVKQRLSEIRHNNLSNFDLNKMPSMVNQSTDQSSKDKLHRLLSSFLKHHCNGTSVSELNSPQPTPNPEHELHDGGRYPLLGDAVHRKLGRLIKSRLNTAEQSLKTKVRAKLVPKLEELRKQTPAFSSINLLTSLHEQIITQMGKKLLEQRYKIPKRRTNLNTLRLDGNLEPQDGSTPSRSHADIGGESFYGTVKPGDSINKTMQRKLGSINSRDRYQIDASNILTAAPDHRLDYSQNMNETLPNHPANPSIFSTIRSDHNIAKILPLSRMVQVSKHETVQADNDKEKSKQSRVFDLAETLANFLSQVERDEAGKDE